MKSIILVSWLSLISCRVEEKKFDSKIWRAIDGNNFSQQREPIINDLMTNYLSKGMSYKELINLLGKPEIEEGNTKIGYTLYINYSWGIGIDPVAGRDLIIQLAKDSTVLDYQIVEWEK